jgi:hypothetical protein
MAAVLISREDCVNSLRTVRIPSFTGIEEELADVTIRIMDIDLPGHYRIAQAVCAKMTFNETRPIRHGGKKI